MNAISSSFRRFKLCLPLCSAIGFDAPYLVLRRVAHADRLLHGHVPHEDDAFVSKLMHSVSNDEFDCMWAIIGLASASPSLKSVTKSVDKMCKDPKQSLKLCTIVFQSRYKTDPLYKSMMMELYAKSGFLQHANSMLQKNLASGCVPHMDTWQTLVQSGKDRRQPDFVKRVVSRMEEYSITPPKKILKLLMDTYADSRMPEEALGVLDLMRKRGMFVDAHAYSVCVKACIGSRDNVETLNALVKDIMGGVDKVPHRLWTTILMAYASTGNVDKVISITDDMKTSGIQLSAKDFTAMLRSCREANDIGRGRDMLRHVEHEEYQEEISLATEMIRLYDMCGDIERVIQVFDKIVHSEKSLDKGIFNIVIDIFMNHWSEATDPEEKQFYKNQAKRAFDIAWSQGIVGHSKPSEKGRTIHVDLHRSGLWASQLILMKTIDDEARRGCSGKRIRAIKYITGKGQSTRPTRKISLADIVRTFLYRSDIMYQEDSLGVFNVPKRSIQKIFKSGHKYSLVDPRMFP